MKTIEPIEGRPGFELSQADARALGERLEPMLRAMSRLKVNVEDRRMRGEFRVNVEDRRMRGEFRRLVTQAQEALQELSMFLHYEEFGGGMKPLRVTPPVEGPKREDSLFERADSGPETGRKF